LTSHAKEEIVAIEASLIKPIVEALIAALRKAKTHRLKRNAKANITEAIRELVLLNPDATRAEARIAVARAAGIISEELFRAEEMLSQVRAAKKIAAKKRLVVKKKPARKKP
jgi:hypothetical protein